MKRLMLFLGLFALLPGLSSCGPMSAPMVPRLDDQAQKEVDASWEKALSPVARLNHQLLLDVFVGIGAYQRGVDKLTFRSEKRYSGGLVVMEVHFDRLAPTEDRFEVSVLNLACKLLRRERYGREEVEETYRALFSEIRPTLKDGEREPPELAARRAKQEARWAKIEELFPKPPEQLK